MRKAARSALLWICLLLISGTARAGDDLVILTDTGLTRDGLPVLQVHPRNVEIARKLTSGFVRTILRLYRYEQAYRYQGDASRIEPAYLLLSKVQGGFPRTGFFLDGQEKRETGFVDLHERSPLAGVFGAADQIFPHELGHILLRQLAGDGPEGGSNQIHAVAVCTDPSTAFQEGFAEHLQVQACDHPDADSTTRAMLADSQARAYASKMLALWQRELCARVSLFPRARMTFPLWFSRVEQIQRYYDVKDNAFARAPRIPERLLTSGDLYKAYLLDNVLPGSPTDPQKRLPRLISTEGVVSAFFCRLVTQPSLRNRFLEDGFYARFGVARGDVPPEENIYLKLFHVFSVGKPHDVLALIDSYKSAFPEETAAVDSVATEVFLRRPLERPPALWMSNPDARIGTSLFDQYRAQPRPAVFDLNAASAADLAAVRGLDPALAQAIVECAPFSRLADLDRVPGLTQQARDRLRDMAEQYSRVQSAHGNLEESLTISSILRPYLWRALLAWLLAAGCATAAYRRVRSCSWRRAAANGVGAGLVGLLFGWFGGGVPGPVAFAAVLVLFGVPAAIWTAFSRRGLRATLTALAAWAVAALPAAVFATPWF